MKAKLNIFTEGKSGLVLVSFLTMEKKSSNPREKKFCLWQRMFYKMSTLPEMQIALRCELQFISVGVLCIQDNCLKHSGDKQTTWPQECAGGAKAMETNKQITIICHQSPRSISS